MDTWEEKYLKLVAEHDNIMTELQKLKKGKDVNPDKLIQCENTLNAWRERTGQLHKELIDLYEKSFALKVESFFKTMWVWAKSGFKLVKGDLGDKRFAICQTCPHLKKDRCTLCGCFMKKKSKIPGALCPIKKWKKVEKNDKRDPKST